MTAGRRLAYLQLVTPTASGGVFPLGQQLLADGFPCPPDDRRACAFLWHLAGPRTAVTGAGAQPCEAILAALVDAAIRFSSLAGTMAELVSAGCAATTGVRLRRRANRHAAVQQAAGFQMTHSSAPTMEAPGTPAEQGLSSDAGERAIERASSAASCPGWARRSSSTYVEGIVKALELRPSR
jgi:hypothetical protein